MHLTGLFGEKMRGRCSFFFHLNLLAIDAKE